MPLAGGPPEEHLQGSQHRLLTAEGEWRAVGLAVVIQVALVTLQDRQGDVFRVDQVPLVTPGDEALQGAFAGLDRLGTAAVYGRPFQEAARVGIQRIAVRGRRRRRSGSASVFGSKHGPPRQRVLTGTMLFCARSRN